MTDEEKMRDITANPVKETLSFILDQVKESKKLHGLSERQANDLLISIGLNISCRICLRMITTLGIEHNDEKIHHFFKYVFSKQEEHMMDMLNDFRKHLFESGILEQDEDDETKLQKFISRIGGIH